MNRILRWLRPGGWLVALLGMTCLGGALFNAELVRERHELLKERALLRHGGADEGGDASRNEEEAADSRRALDRETARLLRAEKKLAAMQKALPSTEGEQLRSFGRIDELAREAAAFLPLLAAFTKKVQGGAARQLPGEDAADATKLIAWTTRLEAIGALEENPAEIAQLHAATLETRLGLDRQTTERVRVQCEEEFEEIKRRGLARPQRPEAAQEEWYRLRKQALGEAVVRVEAVIPASQREPHAVGQSLHLGTALRTRSEVQADGHGSIQMALELPGIEVR